MWYKKIVIEKCPLCKSKDSSYMMTKYDDRYVMMMILIYINVKTVLVVILKTR